MKDASERTDDDIETILDFLIHFPVRITFNSMFLDLFTSRSRCNFRHLLI